MKIVNPFKSHKKKDFVAYWDLKQFSQLLNKGIEVGSDYFFLIKCIENICLFVRESDFEGTKVFEREDKELSINAEGFDDNRTFDLNDKKRKIEFDRLCFEASKLYEGDLCEWFHLTNQLLLEVKEKIKEGYTKLEMTVKPLEEVVDKKYKDFVGSSKKSFISHPEPILYGGSCPKSIFKANIVFSYVKSSSSQELNAEYEGKPLFVNSELAEEIISNNNIRKLEEKFSDLCRKAESEESDNNYEQGISLYSQAINLVGIWSYSAGALFNRARLFRRINQFDNAIKDYDQFIKYNPDDFRGYINRGIVNLEKKDFENSLIDLSKGLEINPNDQIGHSFMADLKKELGNLEEAILSMEKAIEIDPKNGYYFQKKGSLYFDLDNYEKAERDYTKAIELGDNGPISYFNRGLSKRLMEDSKGACEDWKKAAELGDKNAEELFNKYCS